jgi:hypothetical protein
MNVHTPKRRPAALNPVARLAPLNTTWQAERRLALAILRRNADTAHARCDWAVYDAMLFARMDMEDLLRHRAAATIAESCTMQYVHEVLP